VETIICYYILPLSQPSNTFGSPKMATWRATGQTSGWSLKTPMTNLKVSETGARNANHTT
jgi:hypothetical protein